MTQPKLPTAVEIVQRFSEWDTEHAAIISQYESGERREKRMFNDARKAIDAEINSEKEALARSQAIHPSVLRFFEEKRAARLNQLQVDYDSRKTQRKEAHAQTLLKHMERYGAYIGLASSPAPVTADSVSPSAVWKHPFILLPIAGIQSSNCIIISG